MTHEPECRSFDGGHICICDVIRPAYQRGREDSADAIANIKELVIALPGEGDWVNRKSAITAARWDGEQE